MAEYILRLADSLLAASQLYRPEWEGEPSCPGGSLEIKEEAPKRQTLEDEAKQKGQAIADARVAESEEKLEHERKRLKNARASLLATAKTLNSVRTNSNAVSRTFGDREQS